MRSRPPDDPSPADVCGTGAAEPSGEKACVDAPGARSKRARGAFGSRRRAASGVAGDVVVLSRQKLAAQSVASGVSLAPERTGMRLAASVPARPRKALPRRAPGDSGSGADPRGPLMAQLPETPIERSSALGVRLSMRPRPWAMMATPPAELPAGNDAVRGDLGAPRSAAAGDSPERDCRAFGADGARPRTSASVVHEMGR